MKILTVADTTVKELLENKNSDPRLKNIDLIMACGDLQPEYLTQLRNYYEVPLFYILGNHDIRYDISPPKGCNLLDRQLIQYNGLSILGFSGSRWYNGNPNQYHEKEMARFVKRMRFELWHKGRPDIVFTHAPPRFIHDAEDPCHKGFRVFRWFIDKYQPAYFIHGHIHRSFASDTERITTVGKTKIINTYEYFILEF